MKRFLPIVVFLLPLAAFSMERLPEDALLNLGHACWEEEIRSASGVEIPAGEGSRTVCGPNYWGESALDRVCAEEVTEGETVYQRCHWRRPEKVESERGFREVLEYRQGPVDTCGGSQNAGEELVEEGWLWSNLLPDLYAHENWGALAEPWGEAVKIQVSDALWGAVVNILYALGRNDPEVVGTLGSEERMYLYDALDAAWVLSYLLAPGRNTSAVPQQWSWFVEMLRDNFFPLWVGDCTVDLQATCSLAWTSHLNSFSVRRSRMDRPGTLGVLSAVAVHEMAHNMFNYTRGRYTGPTSHSVRGTEYRNTYNTYNNTPGGGLFYYESEGTASIIGSLVFNYLDPPLQAMEPEQEGVRWLRSSMQTNFVALWWEGGEAVRLNLPADPSLADLYFWDYFESLDPDRRMLWRETCAGCREGELPCGEEYNIYDHQTTICRQCLTVHHVMTRYGPRDMEGSGGPIACDHPRPDNWPALFNIEVYPWTVAWTRALLSLEDALRAAGGPFGLAGPNLLPPQTSHPSLHRDYLVSPSDVPVPGGGQVGESPPAGFSPAPGGHLGQEGAPPSGGAPLDPDCLYGGIQNCAVEYCFDNFALGLDRGLCELATNAPCRASDAPEYCYDRCAMEPGRFDYCGELCQLQEGWCRERCAENPNFSTTCGDLCFGNMNWCGDMCERHGPASIFCVNWCNQISDPFSLANDATCRETCLSNTANLPRYCRESCESRGWPSAPLCNRICERNPAIEGCDRNRENRERADEEREEREAEESCQTRCLSYCNNNCSRLEAGCPDLCRSLCAANPEREAFQCPQPPEPPPEPPDDDGCPSGWEERYDLLYVTRNDCFPFIGPIRCCGSDCEPAGPNEACQPEGWCGCPTTVGATWRGWCDAPAASGVYMNGHFGVEELRRADGAHCLYTCVRTTDEWSHGCECFSDLNAVGAGLCHFN